MTCPLCEMEKLSEWKIVVCKCINHPSKWMIVWGKHEADPPEEMKEKMKCVMEVLFPGIQLRGPRSIPQHFHWHEV